MLLQRLSAAGVRGARVLRQAGCPTQLSRQPGRRLVSNRRPAAAPPAAATAEAGTSAAAAAGDAQPPTGHPAPAYKVPLDFKFIRDNVELVSTNCRQRNNAADPTLVVQLYEEFVALKAESEALRASRNENSASMKVGGD
jgi:hypothetical protein